jgi:putative ATPase
MDCLPDKLKGREFYTPTDFGFEKDIAKRLAWWKKRRGGSSDVP